MNNIKLIIFDVDGTLTDGKLYIGESGEALKTFSVKDGYAIVNILPLLNITPIIITGRASKILLARCNELGITNIYQGVKNKIEKLKEICNEFDCGFENVAYIGDDLNDLECMQVCGLKGCPADAMPEVKNICDFVATRNGGEGAVREFIDYIKTLTK